MKLKKQLDFKMREKPLVSIITVVYNGANTIEQTINSVINQTYKNIEYIIIDGESTDGTLEILKKYSVYIKVLVSEKDNGLYDAMNKGINLANGELIGMINSDDWYEPNAVETMVNAYLENPSKMIFHADRYDVYSDSSKKVQEFNASKFKFKYYAMTYNHPSMFIVKEEYNQHMYSTKLRALSDYQFVLEAFLRDPNTFVYINKPIVNYRLDGVSAQMSFKDRMREGYDSRKESGMSIFGNLLALLIRALLTTKNYIVRNDK